jgi:hypothetical protein
MASAFTFTEIATVRAVFELLSAINHVMSGLCLVLVCVSCSPTIGPGDPGLVFEVTNMCGFDVDVDIRLPNDSLNDWYPIVSATTIRFAQADAEPEEFATIVRRPDQPGGDTVTVVPTSASVTLGPGSGCPA